MGTEGVVSFGQLMTGIGSGILWVLTELVMAFYNFAYAITHPGCGWTGSQGSA